MHICLDQDVDTANSIKVEFFVFVVSPVSLSCHVVPTSIILFVALGEHNIPIKGFGQLSTFVRFDPGIVIKSTFDVDTVSIAVKPDICELSVPEELNEPKKHTGYQNVLVVRNEILNDFLRTVDNIHISPIDPRMVWLESG